MVRTARARRSRPRRRPGRPGFATGLHTGCPACLSPPPPPPPAAAAAAAAPRRARLDAARGARLRRYADALLSELDKEMENGRLLRLLSKLNYSADREVLEADEGWGAHPDRQLLRMFRDSLFAQVDEVGAAVVDYAHVVNGLNKLDFGHEGKVCLSSPSDGSLMLVSYKDLKTVLERSFAQLAASAGEAVPDS